VRDDVISGYSYGWNELRGGNLKELSESIAGYKPTTDVNMF
jgi:hypothetical protein